MANITHDGDAGIKNATGKREENKATGRIEEKAKRELKKHSRGRKKRQARRCNWGTVACV